MIIGFGVLMSAQVYVQILLGAIIIGFGTGFFPPAAYALISDLFNNYRGRAVGIYLSAFNFGGVAASMLAIGALAIGTWRFAFPPVLVVLLAVALLMHSWNQEPYIFSKMNLEIANTARGIADSGKLRLIIIAMGLFMITWQGIINFLPTFLQIEKGWSGAAASQAFAGIFIISMAGNPIAGGIGDKFGYPQVASGAAVLTMIGLITMTIMDLTNLIIAGIIIFAVGISGFMPVVNTYILDVVPPDNTGGYVGGARTTFLLIGSIGSTYVGVLAEYTSYTISFLGLIPFIVTTLLLTLWLAMSRSVQED
jgi:MFS family permease